MLTVKTKLGPSPIDGLGVIATESIKAGQEVWAFVSGFDSVLDLALVKHLPLVGQEFICRFGAVAEGKVYLDGDDARFMNHSDTPNLKTAFGTAAMVAARNIFVGEELTCDYREFDEPSRDGLEPYVESP